VSGFAPQETALVVDLLARVIANLESPTGT
jgi:hypothetical protein